MIRARGKLPPVILEHNSTSEERTAALAARERHMRNVRWFADHAADIGRDHPGKYICVAGQELFVGTTLEDVLAEAWAKHPDDRGAIFFKYVSTHRGPKLYAYRWILADR